MGASLKCQYGLRALFELSRRYGQGLVCVPDISKAQAIPMRFLENILNQLRQGGFVESRRGKNGGFMLAKPPAAITVADVVEFMDGGIYNIGCDGERPEHICELRGHCVFMPVWREAKKAIENAYRSKTLQNLLEDEGRAPINYEI